MKLLRKFGLLTALSVLLAVAAATTGPALAQSGSAAKKDPWTFWVAVEGKRQGPLNRGRLIQMIRKGQLTKDSLVWREGMERWTPAGRITIVAVLIIEYGPKKKPKPPPPPKFPKFYVIVGHLREGPFDEDGLKKLRLKGDLTRESKVWRRGLDGWQAAETVEELAPFLALRPDKKKPGIRTLVRARAHCKATGHQATRDRPDFIAARTAAIRACVAAGGKFGCCAANVTEIE